MKKILKFLGIAIISILVILYLAFLFVLPNAFNLEQFKPEIQKTVKEQTNLNLDFSDPKISVTPWLEAGIKLNDIKISLPDNSELLNADSLKVRISLPSLLLLSVRVSTAQVENPFINIDIVNGTSFKAVNAIEEILNKQEENIEQTLQTAQKPIIDPSLIKIIVPGLKLKNYAAYINDLKTENSLNIKGDELILGYNNGKSVSVKTLAELCINKDKKIAADIDIDTFIPQQSKLDKEDDKAQRVEIPFVNPVQMYMDYDLRANINSKIKVRTKNNKIVSNGYFNVDNFTLKLSDIQLPESKLHIESKGTKINIDSDLFITEDEKFSLSGIINYSKKPYTDINLKTTKIQLQDVINILKATLDSLHIKNELGKIKGEGYFSADTGIKTNFKKLNSQGNITVNKCIIKNTAKNKKLANINSIISLDNNILKFIDTSVEIADTLFKIEGTIDDKSYADILVLMESMPLSKVFDLFIPDDISKNYIVNSGNINLTADIKGELKKAISSIKLSLDNLSLTDKVNNINYKNNLLTANFNSNFKSFTGDINNSGFKLTMNGANIFCDNAKLNIGEKDIVIDPSKITINNSTNIDFSGFIKEYAKNPIFNFEANGKVRTKDLKQFLGSDLAIFIKEKGIIPISINLNGNKKKQTLSASIEADSDNYITPVDIDEILNKNTVINAVIDFKGDRLKIKDTGFFIKELVKDPENPEKTTIKLNEIVGVDGTITKLNTSNPNINLIKVKMPNNINGSICAFPKSRYTAKGNMYILGEMKAPRVRGEFNLWNISIPELFISINKVFSKFEGKDLNININNLIANGSDYDVTIDADLTPSKNFTIKNLNLLSKLTDADKLMKVSEAAMKYMPQSPSSQKTSQPSNQADIPVIIKNGNIDIKTIKTGNIILNNTTGDISLFNNIFYVNNILTSAFKGTIKGDVSMNLLSSEIKAKLKGNNLDVEKTLLDAAAMKDTLSGVMDFDTNISLKGATYEEQMKSLKGEVNFIMKNGQLGPFGKLENLIMAENIRESAFFQSTIGSVLNSLLSFDTADYNELKGNLTFNNGITNINPITSQGDIMATHIFGTFDLLKNKIDIKLRGRLGSQVSDSMGPLALLNPVNLVKATPGMSLVLGKMFFLFCETVTNDELNLIPSLGKDISDTNATKFQVVIRGDVAKPLTLVKSFKWLALQSEIDNAEAYLKSIPQDTIPTDILNTNPEEIKTQVKEKVKKEAKKKLEDKANEILTEEAKENIKQNIDNIEKNKENISKLKSLLKNKEEAKKVLKKQLEEAQKPVEKSAQNNLKEQTQEETIKTEITE